MLVAGQKDSDCSVENEWLRQDESLSLDQLSQSQIQDTMLLMTLNLKITISKSSNQQMKSYVGLIFNPLGLRDSTTAHQCEWGQCNHKLWI